jgi:predicted membrane channel-forming protein YqfA (hemolysin III family)
MLVHVIYGFNKVIFDERKELLNNIIYFIAIIFIFVGSVLATLRIDEKGTYPSWVAIIMYMISLLLLIDYKMFFGEEQHEEEKIKEILV